MFPWYVRLWFNAFFDLWLCVGWYVMHVLSCSDHQFIVYVVVKDVRDCCWYLRLENLICAI